MKSDQVLWSFNEESRYDFLMMWYFLIEKNIIWYSQLNQYDINYYSLLFIVRYFWFFARLANYYSLPANITVYVVTYYIII